MTDTPPAPPKRSLATKACDGCRLRKVKCKDAKPGSPCSRCSHLSLACTFDIPSSTRGPKRRKHTFSPPGNEKNRNSHQTATESPTNGATLTTVEPRRSAHGSSIVHLLNSSTSPPQHETHSHPPIGYATDQLCPRDFVLLMLEDYLISLYPLIPIVHRPTFKHSLATNQDSEDSDFLGLIVALCATVVGTIPSKFEEYRKRDPPLEFDSRGDFIHQAYVLLLNMRGPDYFDNISFQKFSTSYLFDIAFFQVGHVNRARMLEVECSQIARMLALHRITEYRGLNHIETQLRKKGFWLLFYSYVHSQVQSLRKERITFLDPVLIQTVDLEALMPLDIDDESIFEDHIAPPPNPSPQPNLTTAFNITSLTFLAAIQSRPPCTPATLTCTACRCTHHNNRQAQISHLQSRLHELRHILTTLPPELRPWNEQPIQPTSSLSPQEAQTLTFQFSAARANLHVTHLWLRSILLDQLEALLTEGPPPSPTDPQHPTPFTHWPERESLSTHLIHLLHLLPSRAIEPNGIHLAYKTRDVAVGLLSCPFEPHEETSQRAAELVREFTRILSELDTSEAVTTTNLQTWVDTDRERGRRGREGWESTFCWK